TSLSRAHVAPAETYSTIGFRFLGVEVLCFTEMFPQKSAQPRTECLCSLANEASSNCRLSEQPIQLSPRHPAATFTIPNASELLTNLGGTCRRIGNPNAQNAQNRADGISEKT